MSWHEDYRNFEGTAAETADALEQITSSLPWARGAPRPNVRLIRHYVQAGGLGRPDRRGKEAYYSFAHIAQFLALRALLIEGWPLRKAADEVGARSLEQLFDLIPADDEPPIKEGVFAKFGGLGPNTRDPVAERQSRLAERRSRLASLLPSLREDAPSDVAQPLMRIDLTPWCHALVTTDRLAAITDAEAETLGDALAQGLIDSRGAAKRRRGS